MPSGRPRKPRALKVLEGTLNATRDRPEPEYEPTNGAEAPEWLHDGPATDEWNRLVPLLEDQGVLVETDVPALAHYCNLHGRVVKKWLADSEPTAAMLMRLAAMQGRFGLTPADRGNVRPNPRPKSNKFGELAG